MRAIFLILTILTMTTNGWAGLGLEDSIQTLNTRSFAFYDLHLSPDEQRALQQVKISSTEQYNNFGHLDTLQFEVKTFISSLGKGNETLAASVSVLIARLVQDVLRASGRETAWVCIRAFTPTDEYDTPRWHTDGYYYAPYEGESCKFALALKGPGTLFYQETPEGRMQFKVLQQNGREDDHYNRQPLADLLSQHPERSASPGLLQGAVFIVGSEGRAAIHSEPPIPEERLFLSILPGTPEQIKEWENRK